MNSKMEKSNNSIFIIFTFEISSFQISTPTLLLINNFSNVICKHNNSSTIRGDLPTP